MSRRVADLAVMVVVGVAITLAGCATTERDWQEARERDTISGYEVFLDKHSGSNFEVAARERIDAFRDTQDWRSAEAQGSAAAYERYVGQHPEGKYAATAKERIRTQAVKDQLLAARTARVECAEEFRQIACQLIESNGWKVVGESPDLVVSISFIPWSYHLRMIEDQIARLPKFAPEDFEKMVSQGSSTWAVGVEVKNGATGEKLLTVSGAHSTTIGELLAKGKDPEYQKKAFLTAMEEAVANIRAAYGGSR